MTLTDLPAVASPVVDLQLSPPVNLRDLGGTPVAGGVLRDGFALRADDLALLDPDSATALVDGGLRAVIDLRSAFEVGLSGRGVLSGMPVAYHHLPLLSDITGEGGPGPDAMHPVKIGNMYVGLVENAAHALVAALGVLAWSPGAVAFHCAAGKDRTGVLAASLLLALGADEETVVADYARTEPNVGAIHARMRPMMEPLLANFGLDLDTLAKQATGSSFSAQAMVLMLTTLRARHGDPLAPLRAVGLTDALVGQLRVRGGVA